MEKTRFQPSGKSQPILQFTLRKRGGERRLPHRPGPAQHECPALEEAWGKRRESWRGLGILGYPIVGSLVPLVCDEPHRPQQPILLLLMPRRTKCCLDGPPCPAVTRAHGTMLIAAWGTSLPRLLIK